MPTTRRPVERGINNDELTDRDMLAHIAAAIDADGWATTTEIAQECGFSDEAKHLTAARKVSTRLVWMRKGGLLVSTPGVRGTRWQLTQAGRAIVGGKLSKAVTNALSRMDEGARLLLMRELAEQGYVNGSEATAFAIRRECLHHLHQRRLVYSR